MVEEVDNMMLLFEILIMVYLFLMLIANSVIRLLLQDYQLLVDKKVEDMLLLLMDIILHLLLELITYLLEMAKTAYVLLLDHQLLLLIVQYLECLINIMLGIL